MACDGIQWFAEYFIADAYKHFYMEMKKKSHTISDNDKGKKTIKINSVLWYVLKCCNPNHRNVRHATGEFESIVLQSTVEIGRLGPVKKSLIATLK